MGKSWSTHVPPGGRSQALSVAAVGPGRSAGRTDEAGGSAVSSGSPTACGTGGRPPPRPLELPTQGEWPGVGQKGAAGVSVLWGSRPLG